jgi:hypothetical protein
MPIHMANTLSEIPVRHIINNPHSQIIRSERSLRDMPGLFEPEQPEPETKKAAKKMRYQKLESRSVWRALKTLYWIFSSLLIVAEAAHTFAMAVTVGVNPPTAAATAVCLYAGICILFYFILRRLSAYVAFGRL